MSRFIAWLAVGIASAFVVVASAAFSPPAAAALAFAISIGTGLVSVGIAYFERDRIASAFTAVLIGVISGWTIVASLVFFPTTVRHLSLASSLAIAALAIVGLTEHEVSLEHAAGTANDTASDQEGSMERDARLATAA